MTRKRKSAEARSNQPCSFFRKGTCKAGVSCLLAHAEESKNITPDISAQVENLARVVPADARDYFKTHCERILLESAVNEIQTKKYIDEIMESCCNWFRIASMRRRD
jgi:hypothetical protein